MEIEKYTPNSLSVGAILGLIASGDIAIPEIQRPFVWKKTQVRDLLDSLYKGYPTGYLIIWKNPDVRLKDGKISAGKKILIDGQQRVTALMTAISGIPVTNSNYRKERIKIAFDPFPRSADQPVFLENALVFQPERQKLGIVTLLTHHESTMNNSIPFSVRQ